MKVLKRAGALSLLVLACAPAAAFAHTGSATVSCTGADFSFTNFRAGSNTINYKVTVDGVVAAEGTYVLDQAGGAQGHLAVPLTIYDSHQVTAYAWWGPVGTVDGHTRPASSPPLADQTVNCPAAPAPPVATPSPPAPVATAPVAATPAAAPAPQIAVQGERVVSVPAPRLRVQQSCAATHARVTVTGVQMRTVRFSVKGRPARTVTVAPGKRSVRALVPLRMHGPAAQRVTTRITFRNGARPRTLVAVATRCGAAAVAPKFTG
jgi:hypothetical protein